MNHIQITIDAIEVEQEILIGQLSTVGATGFEQNDNNLIAYFEENNFKSYDVNSILNGNTFYISTIEEKNWNELWESNFHPVVVHDFCCIRAHFHEHIANVAHDIIITPKMSFGTGHHATTFMMIEQMSDIIFSDKNVFDFGTGTGILSILAEKLGASSITAIDNDNWSIENAKENVVRNGGTKINVHLAEEIPNKTFDIILANINKNVILQNVSNIKIACKENTLVLVSGLLINDEKEVIDGFEQNDFKLVKQTNKSNWISLLFANK